MTKEEFQKLLDRHLNGEASEAEKNQLEKFERHFLEKNESSIFKSPEEKIKIYNEIRSRIEPPAEKGFSWLKLAAAILIFVGMAYSLFHVAQNTESYTTSFGEKVNLSLPDGSIVQLNGGSSLQFSSWWGNERKVELDGEAFFKVAKDKAHPFVVYANGIKTRALGTEFNVNSYPEDSLVSISLLEGSVEVKGFHQTDTLSPNEQASFKLNNGSIEVASFQTEKVLAWRSNKLVLSKTSFGQLARILRRNYGITLSFSDESFERYTVSGQLDDSDVQSFLEAVSATKGLKVDRLEANSFRIHKTEGND